MNVLALAGNHTLRALALFHIADHARVTHDEDKARQAERKAMEHFEASFQLRHPGK